MQGVPRRVPQWARAHRALGPVRTRLEPYIPVAACGAPRFSCASTIRLSTAQSPSSHLQCHRARVPLEYPQSTPRVPLEYPSVPCRALRATGSPAARLRVRHTPLQKRHNNKINNNTHRRMHVSSHYSTCTHRWAYPHTQSVTPSAQSVARMRGDADALGERGAALLVVHGLAARAFERHHGAKHRFDVRHVLQHIAAPTCAGRADELYMYVYVCIKIYV